MKIFNYPAMASPQSIDAIDKIISSKLKTCSSILDPFCGTGRLLVRPRTYGHNVVGIDCSPLAILASKCAHHPVSVEKISYVIKEITTVPKTVDSDLTPTKDKLFWFTNNSIAQLHNLLYCIEDFKCSKSVRRILWLILADTSRSVSYIREQEYKLHRINENERKIWNPDVIASFKNSGTIICKRLIAIKSQNMKGRFRFYQGDLAKFYGNKHFSRNVFDAIITSPPYGDSASTVGYGQFARIPLMILANSKLFTKEFDLSFKKNFDSKCMGGFNCFPSDYEIIEPEIPEKIKSRAMKRFNRDYFIRISMLLDTLRRGGIISLIVADRVSNGTRYPLVDLTVSYLMQHKLKKIFQYDRYLSHKRLPRTMKHSHKNRAKSHNGINYETILCFQKI